MANVFTYSLASNSLIQMAAAEHILRLGRVARARNAWTRSRAYAQWTDQLVPLKRRGPKCEPAAVVSGLLFIQFASKLDRLSELVVSLGPPLYTYAKKGASLQSRTIPSVVENESPRRDMTKRIGARAPATDAIDRRRNHGVHKGHFRHRCGNLMDLAPASGAHKAGSIFRPRVAVGFRPAVGLWRSSTRYAPIQLVFFELHHLQLEQFARAEANTRNRAILFHFLKPSQLVRSRSFSS